MISANDLICAAAIENHGRALKLKWSHQQLRTDLAGRYGDGSWERLQHTIKQALVRTVNASLAALTSGVGNTSGTFQLFGADFLVDDQLRPWLTEVRLICSCDHSRRHTTPHMHARARTQRRVTYAGLLTTTVTRLIIYAPISGSTWARPQS